MEKKYLTNRGGGNKAPEKVHRPGFENTFERGPEAGRQVFEVSNLEFALLRELSDFLQREKIDLNQKMLKTGEVSEGYHKKGVRKFGDNLIGFELNDTNYIIKGTREEFLLALEKVNHPL